MIPANAAPLAIALLGLVLGMRHATDPDHVIAVTTILSREHRLAAATRIGVIWGLGHTLTVLIVGAAIIIFKLAVPVRLGLAMEFAVAITLILLGLSAVGGLSRQLASRVFGIPLSAASEQSKDLPEDLIVHSHSHAHAQSHTHDRPAHRHPHVHGAGREFSHREHVMPPDVPAPGALPGPRDLRTGQQAGHTSTGPCALSATCVPGEKLVPPEVRTISGRASCPCWTCTCRTASWPW